MLVASQFFNYQFGMPVDAECPYPISGKFGHTFLPKKEVGRCIYCGETEAHLRIEHPLPDALGCRVQLSKACCETCQNKINPFEQKILRETWGAPRTILEIRAQRRRKRERAGQYLIRPDGSRTEVPVRNADVAILLLVPDGLPQMQTKGVEWPHEKIQLRYLNLGPKDGSVEGQYEVRFTPVDFYRFLCKVAHGLAVYSFGVNYFDPLLSEFVLTGQGNYKKFLGACETEVVPDQLHRCEYFSVSDSQKALLGVKLHLFSQYVTVAYHIIVGTVRTPQGKPA